MSLWQKQELTPLRLDMGQNYLPYLWSRSTYHNWRFAVKFDRPNPLIWIFASILPSCLKTVTFQECTAFPFAGQAISQRDRKCTEWIRFDNSAPLWMSVCYSPVGRGIGRLRLLCRWPAMQRTPKQWWWRDGRFYHSAMNLFCISKGQRPLSSTILRQFQGTRDLNLQVTVMHMSSASWSD